MCVRNATLDGAVIVVVLLFFGIVCRILLSVLCCWCVCNPILSNLHNSYGYIVSSTVWVFVCECSCGTYISSPLLLAIYHSISFGCRPLYPPHYWYIHSFALSFLLWYSFEKVPHLCCCYMSVVHILLEQMFVDASFHCLSREKWINWVPFRAQQKEINSRFLWEINGFSLWSYWILVATLANWRIIRRMLQVPRYFEMRKRMNFYSRQQ